MLMQETSQMEKNNNHPLCLFHVFCILKALDCMLPHFIPYNLRGKQDE